MVKYIYNTTEEEIVYLGKTFPAEGYRDIPLTMGVLFASSSEILTDIGNGVIIISKTEDSSGHLDDINAAINFLKGNLPSLVESTVQPFGSKTLSNGKKLFRRVHGTSGSVQDSSVNIDFTVPYANCKITGVQILNGKMGDTVNFKVLDTDAGLITGIPNYMLNQFAFDVAVIPEVASYPSKYDADLIGGMILRVEYDPIDEESPRTIYVNLDLHEVKD